MKSLRISNSDLWGYVDRNPQTGEIEVVKSLHQWLDEQLLHGKESRARSRFVKFLIPLAQTIEAEKQKMIAEGTKKNEKGEVLFLDKDGKETTDSKLAAKNAFTDEAKLQADIGDYLNEPLVIDVTPANAETIQVIKNILLNTPAEFKGTLARRYESWCNSFESLEDEKKNKKI